MSGVRGAPAVRECISLRARHLLSLRRSSPLEGARQSLRGLQAAGQSYHCVSLGTLRGDEAVCLLRTNSRGRATPPRPYYAPQDQDGVRQLSIPRR